MKNWLSALVEKRALDDDDRPLVMDHGLFFQKSQLHFLAQQLAVGLGHRQVDESLIVAAVTSSLGEVHELIGQDERSGTDRLL